MEECEALLRGAGCDGVLVVRLCAVAPDGSSHRVTYGRAPTLFISLSVSTLHITFSFQSEPFCVVLSLKFHPTHLTKRFSGGAKKWTKYCGRAERRGRLRGG